MLVRLKPIDLRMKEKSSYIQDHLCSCSILSFYHIYVHSSNSKFKLDTWLRWWLRGKEPACQCRRHVLDPWSGKIPHAAGQLSPCATTTKPVLWSPGAAAAELMCPRTCAPQQEKPPREARVLQLERIGPCLLQLEKHQEATEIQHIQK